ncbi:MAG: hypothetical protein E6J43_13490 [Chloroflexi bacterium]|nr:MAG: hypothetical protein E6J43_13490 [Chloroflexota bacterium]
MGFLSRSIPDDEWTNSARTILDGAIEPATALSDAIRREDMERQADAILEITRRFPSLKDSLRGIGSPTSAEARRAKKNLELALQDYVDGASQGHKLLIDLREGLGGRITSGGFAGRAATSRFVFQESFYKDIVKKAEGRLETARTFLTGQPEGRPAPDTGKPGRNKAAGPPLTQFFIDAVDELRESFARQKQLTLSQVATTGSWCFSQAAILGMVVSTEPDEFLGMVLQRIDSTRISEETSLGYLVMITNYPELYSADALATAVASGRSKDVERLANSSVLMADARMGWSMDTAMGLGVGIRRPDFIRSCLEAQAHPNRKDWANAYQAGLAIPAEPDAMSADDQVEGVLEVCRAYFEEYYPHAKRRLDELTR